MKHKSILTYFFFFISLAFFGLLLPIPPSHAVIFEVGPRKQFERISQVPFDSLNPGDVVRIFFRELPYREKFIIRRSGTEKAPIIITGVPKNGKLPVIDGARAVQFQGDMKNQSGRWLIKVGDNTPGDYVRIKNLDLRNANNSQSFIFRGVSIPYSDNGSGVFVARGRHVTILGCIILRCGNGVQTSYHPKVNHTTLRNCLIYDNGNFINTGSSQEHNVYLCGTRTTVEFCRFGQPHSDGNNVKDRGIDTVIRYNWIEGGKNRQLDLVDHEEYKKADAYVYGNVIIQGQKIHNHNMVHWGGDSGFSRSGILRFFNNTVIGRSRSTLFLLTRYSDCALEVKNNAFVGIGVLWNGKGAFRGSHNWISSAIIIPPHKALGIQGAKPGFMSKFGIPYLPRPGSPLVGTGINRVPLAVRYMPKRNGGGIRRPRNGSMDIGAYESGNFWFNSGKRKDR